ncbi:nitrilase/cyanide hydratase and apolipoprotein N-acyltransferase [Moraxella macacae 0408225]|uniref:Nitrilase/cyanide hydratase and apolipoprotein N-acyltransferase n=1 Tax=Moraxella macacae 0408225 TaxID=1230338 RepID=L2F6I7_9GAMM|nr:nitrilase-related carbon-nitrogen hydrolase [Moraxella macacae]ELA08411.1 nitrilase/cyanide hydratase and apolipoprotein N-acyltransferase [Moraxella macacae 0408225]
MPKVACVQLNSQTDILANLIQIESAVKTAVSVGVSLVVLPENAFCFGKQSLAAQYFHALHDWCSKISQHYQIHLLAGTLPCPFRPNGMPVASGKFRQTSLLFDPSGDCVARYDKIHLFKATVNDSIASYDEGITFEAGNEPVVAKTVLGNIGMMVCFDLRFASLAIRLRQLGAEILTIPSAFTYATGKAHWQTLLTARALDSQCLTLGAGQTGTHLINDRHRQTWGHSQIINAYGETIGKYLTKPLPNFDALPISQQATSWLDLNENSTNKKPDNYQLINYQLIIADFDNAQQQIWRQNMDLMASLRFDIHNPC